MSTTLDDAKRDLALENLLVVARRVCRRERPGELSAAVKRVDDIDRVLREDREADAVDALAEMLEHEPCSYTLHATYPEIAVHLALIQKYGPQPSCV